MTHVMDDGMPPRSQMEDFVRHFLRTGNRDQSYRLAMGVPMGKGTRNSANWIRHPYVKRRIAEEMKKMQEKTNRSFDDHLTQLEDLRDAAKNDGKWSAAINAEVARGKALGYYNHKRKIEITDPRDIDTAALIEQLNSGKGDQFGQQVLEDLTSSHEHYRLNPDDFVEGELLEHDAISSSDN